MELYIHSYTYTVTYPPENPPTFMSYTPTESDTDNLGLFWYYWPMPWLCLPYIRGTSFLNDSLVLMHSLH